MQFDNGLYTEIVMLLRLMICMVVFLCTTEWMFAAGKVQVYILAGQSNMQGQGVVDFDHPEYYNGGKGILPES